MECKSMFELQFNPQCIPSLAAQYLKTGNGAEKDEAMATAGLAINKGERTRKNLEEIYHWKSPRSVHRLAPNQCADIDRSLLQAIHAIQEHDDRAAITALIRTPEREAGLYGVRVPVASAILTAIAPKRFTVIDYKALGSLGCPQESPGVGFYLAYLCACRRICQANQTCLRTLDRALWQWWKNQEQAGKGVTDQER
jgi:hypothetical protein